MLSPIKRNNNDLKLDDDEHLFEDKSLLTNEVNSHNIKNSSTSEHLHNEKINYLK